MKQHRKNNRNPDRQEVIHPLINQDDNFHFPENGIPNFKLANEIGLSLNNQSIHRQVNIASLLNDNSIRAFQFIQAESASDEKSKNVPDVIWATRLGNKTITSPHEMAKPGLFYGRRSILGAKAERHEK